MARIHEIKTETLTIITRTADECGDMAHHCGEMVTLTNSAIRALWWSKRARMWRKRQSEAMARRDQFINDNPELA